MACYFKRPNRNIYLSYFIPFLCLLTVGCVPVPVKKLEVSEVKIQTKTLSQYGYDQISRRFNAEPIICYEQWNIAKELWRTTKIIRDLAINSSNDSQFFRLAQPNVEDLERIIRRVLSFRKDKYTEEILLGQLRELGNVQTRDTSIINSRTYLIDFLANNELYKSIDHSFYKFPKIEIGVFNNKINRAEDSTEIVISPLGLSPYFNPYIIIDEDTLKPKLLVDGIARFRVRTSEYEDKLKKGKYQLRHNGKQMEYPFEINFGLK